uniref:Myb/SANT-like domain-containing protein n=1 Tax=Triticum urartu TaxID=4572 RepID=A0A8R7REA9_TRIUA
MDEAMLNVFVEHYNRGDRAQNGWKPHVFTAVVNNVRAKCNVDITKENVISRCKTIDRHYVNVSKMLSTSGFGWDWTHNKLMVDSEDVWSNYVKANKDAACYRHKVIKFWDSISLVFLKDHATGTGARTAAESAAEMAAENVNNVNIESAATSSTQTGEEQKKKDTDQMTQLHLCLVKNRIILQAPTKLILLKLFLAINPPLPKKYLMLSMQLLDLMMMTCWQLMISS